MRRCAVEYGAQLKNDFLSEFTDGKRGYLKVKLYTIDNKAKRGHTMSVHRLVGLSFKGLPYDSLFTVDHLDGVVTNNNINNLDICSNAANIRRAIERRTSKYRESQLLLSDVHAACELLFEYGLGPKVVSDTLGISYHAVKKISQKKNHRSIIAEYTEL